MGVIMGVIMGVDNGCVVGVVYCCGCVVGVLWVCCGCSHMLLTTKHNVCRT